jgi:hypothetical protein
MARAVVADPSEQDEVVTAELAHGHTDTTAGNIFKVMKLIRFAGQGFQRVRVWLRSPAPCRALPSAVAFSAPGPRGQTFVSRSYGRRGAGRGAARRSARSKAAPKKYDVSAVFSQDLATNAG